MACEMKETTNGTETLLGFLLLFCFAFSRLPFHVAGTAFEVSLICQTN